MADGLRPMCWGARGAEPVANVPHRFDILGDAIVDLAAKSADVHINGAGASKVVVAPDLAQRGLPVVHPSWVGRQEAKELVLFEREDYSAATAGHPIPVQVK